MSRAATANIADSRDGEILGHPVALFILFFAELWERFSFYGMKAVLMLYMLNYLLWTQAGASQVFAWYTGLIYATTFLGGIVADQFLGARWSVVIGGTLMAAGNFMLVVPELPFFYGGLVLLIIGCGLLKPNISTQVGSLYPSDDQRRDAAFTIFYMGINIGAALAPIVCDWLRIHYGYGYAFATAGVGMVLGLVVYTLGMPVVMRRVQQVAALEAGRAAEGSGASALTNQHTPRHVVRDRIIVLLVIYAFVIVFWMAFEQAANVMTVWADKHTNLYPFLSQAPPAPISAEQAVAEAAQRRGFQLGAGQLQAVNPVFVIALAAVFSWLWIWLERRGRQPSTPLKMCLGFVGMTLAYGVMLLAAQAENRPTQAPLAKLPPGLNLSSYGCTRLTYDERSGMLKMRGVLTDLDWLRLLGDSAPPQYREAVSTLVHKARGLGKREETPAGEVQVTLPAGVPEPVFVEPLPKAIRWDGTTRTFTATGPVSERDKLSLDASGADPEFREAVSAIYRQSSVLKVSVWWLILFYLWCTLGELCLSPVGLSLVTKMAPPRYVGMFMGLWFLTTGGLANYAAHSIGGLWGQVTPMQYFLLFGGMSLLAMVLMFLSVALLRARMHGIH
jgi:POT family proton-dependent oligopeptide transporter